MHNPPSQIRKPTPERDKLQFILMHSNLFQISCFWFLQVGINDVLAEPAGSHSFACVWSIAFCCFTCWKSCCYNCMAVFCGFCMAAFWGCEFATIGFYVSLFHTFSTICKLKMLRVISYKTEARLGFTLNFL